MNVQSGQRGHIHPSPPPTGLIRLNMISSKLLISLAAMYEQ